MIDDRQTPNVIFKLCLAALTIVILLGLICIGILAAQQLGERQHIVEKAHGFETNTDVATAVSETMTANSWTLTPTPSRK